MRKIFIICLLPTLLVSMAFSCEEKENLTEEGCPMSEGEQSITGSWLLYEYGYSPGHEYIVKEVPSKPAQIIDLNPDGTISSTIEGMKVYKFYLILNDKRTNRQILSLYTTDPKDKPQDTDHLSHSYSIEFTENGLSLHYRFCIEGCHLGLKRRCP